MPAIPGVGSGGDETARQREQCAYWFPLPPHPIAAEQARLFTKFALAVWGIPEIEDNALLIASELVTNALKTGDVFDVTLYRRDDAVLIEVWDGSEASPDRQGPSIDRVGGRGLLLVEACSKDWGWRLEDREGKTVWALIGDRDMPADAVAPFPDLGM